MSNKNLNELLQGYLNNSLSAQEVKLLIEYLRREENGEQLQLAIEQALASNTYAGAADKNRTDLLFSGIMQKAGRQKEMEASGEKLFHLKPVKKSFSMWRMAAASVIILLMGAGAYFLFNNKQQKVSAGTEEGPSRFKNDVLPGGDKAVLILADGSEIVLDSAANGALTTQGNTKVLKLNNGQLAYNTLNKTAAEVLHNTISTPRGGQYQVVLPDGTKVWLNAASSLRFPTAFTGKVRHVTLTGEAYFEVAKNAAQPFKVAVNGMEVNVLGTHFNVNAYTDEASVNTTLLEGSVMVTKNGKNVMIKPGQQAQVQDGIKVADQVDIETLMAWKNGRFSYNNADMESIMRQIARWYDVEVAFEDKITDTYTMEISRNVPASKLFRFLELSGGVHFIIDGKKIIVKK